jgi:hypothetical protein
MKLNSGPAGLLVAYTPFALWSPHFETEIEIIQNHLDQGGRAVVLSCGAELKTCEPNPEHKQIICAICKSRLKAGMKWLKGSVSHEDFYCLTGEQQAFIDRLETRTWQDIDEIRSFMIDRVDIGMAALSSTVDAIREPEPDINLHGNLITRHLITAVMVYFSVKNQLTKIKPDEFLTFNGRLSSLRPALRVAQQLGIMSYVHERAGVIDRYCITKGTYPHDLNWIKAEIESVYRQPLLSEEDRQELALGWFKERRDGVDQSWHSFTKNQKRDLLPREFNSNVVNIVIFISSEDEFVAIAEWENPFYKNQNAAIAQLMEGIRGDERLRIFLRVHPNLKGVNNTQTKGIDELARCNPAIHLIPADSPISTYALIDSADVIITYGSTVGIEAAYAGRLSILMGRSPYEDLDVCLRPNSHAELISILKNIAKGEGYPLPAGHKLGIVKYGLFQKLRGYRFSYVRPTGLFSAKMVRGNSVTVLRPNILLRVVAKLGRMAGTLKMKRSPRQ